MLDPTCAAGLTSSRSATIAALACVALVMSTDPSYAAEPRRDLRDAKSRYVDIRNIHFSTVTTLGSRDRDC